MPRKKSAAEHQSRPDVLSHESDVLAQDVTVTGTIIASLCVSTTCTNADWVVKLIDVYPGVRLRYGDRHLFSP